MSDAKVTPAPGEKVIVHPDHEGAIMRIPEASFDPATHTEWDPDVTPWQDGSGTPIPGVEPPSAERPSGKRKSKARGDDAGADA